MALSRAAIQVALAGSTGSPVTGVFQTLSAGNAGHDVPGSTVPAGVVARAAVSVAGVATPVTGAAPAEPVERSDTAPSRVTASAETPERPGRFIVPPLRQCVAGWHHMWAAVSRHARRAEVAIDEGWRFGASSNGEKMSPLHWTSRALGGRVWNSGG